MSETYRKIKEMRKNLKNLESKREYNMFLSNLYDLKQNGEITKKQMKKIKNKAKRHMQRKQKTEKREDTKADFKGLVSDLKKKFKKNDKGKNKSENKRTTKKVKKEKNTEKNNKEETKKEKNITKKDNVNHKEDSKKVSKENVVKLREEKDNDYLYTDKEIVEKGGFIPFEQYWYKIRFNKDINKTMFDVYATLAFFANYNGEIKGLSTKVIADFLDKKSDSRIIQAIKSLEEEELITVKRGSYVNNYQILGYNEAFSENSKGGFFISKKMIKNLQQFNLKHYRLVYYLLSLRHHMPNNKSIRGIQQETLKNITNALSIKEMRSLVKDLSSVFFKSVNNFYKKVNKGRKGIKKIQFNFYTEKLGINDIYIDEKEQRKIKKDSMFKSIKKILKEMDIDTCWFNIKKVLKLFKQAKKGALKEMKRLAQIPKVKSDYNSISFLRYLVESYDTALIN